MLAIVLKVMVLLAPQISTMPPLPMVILETVVDVPVISKVPFTVIATAEFAFTQPVLPAAIVVAVVMGEEQEH